MAWSEPANIPPVIVAVNADSLDRMGMVGVNAAMVVDVGLVMDVVIARCLLCGVFFFNVDLGGANALLGWRSSSMVNIVVNGERRCLLGLGVELVLFL